MCIVIDANTFSSVFVCTTSDHEEFRPILEWVCKGKGKIVFGGTKYYKELLSAPKYLPIIRILNDARKVVRVDDLSVDNAQKRLEQLTNPNSFNDTHIVAIIIVSGCKLICSKDSSAYKYFKEKSFYPKKISRPKIYSGISNKDLLDDRMIAGCCKPTTKTKLLNDLL